MSTSRSSRGLGMTSREVLRTQQFSAVELQAGCSGKLGSPGLGQKPQDWGRRRTPLHMPFLRLSAIYQAAVKVVCKSQVSTVISSLYLHFPNILELYTLRYRVMSFHARVSFGSDKPLC